MASEINPNDRIPNEEHGEPAEPVFFFDFWDAVKTVLKPLASLKLTVALFAMAIVLVLVGTLAQHRKDMWEVIDQYFRTPVAFVELEDLVPYSFWPNRPSLPGGFPFPGGLTVGVLMFLNLFSAHLVRFTVQTRGLRLWGGVCVIAAGCAATWMVIASGSSEEGIQDAAWFGWDTLWWMLVVGLGLVWAASACYACGWTAAWLGGGSSAAWLKSFQKPEWKLLGIASLVSSVGLGGLLAWMLYQMSQGTAVRLDDSSLRILWMLIKSSIAALVLLAGCLMVFRKRGGMVVLHVGIGLMMFSELLVGLTAVEGQMHIPEGKTVNFVKDIRHVELAVVDPSHPDQDDVVVVPQSPLLGSLKGNAIRHDDLPFDVQVVKYYRNSDVRKVKPDDENPATAGTGREWLAFPVAPGTGASSDSEVDIASAYVTFTDKQSGEPIGTYLLTQLLAVQDIAEKIEAGGKTYEVYLRFKRYYKPYSMHLIEVRKDDYLGTNTPRNYSSDLRLVDESRSVDREVKIWMNNPLRFAGETFYQSSYHEDPRNGEKATTLQVVTNTGWMIPYVSCMVVMWGMLAHFWIALLRFLNRQAPTRTPAPATTPLPTGNIPLERGRRKGAAARPMPPIELPPPPTAGFDAVVLPAAVVLLFGVLIGYTALLASKGGKARPQATETGMNLHEFGRLPVVEGGRSKPIDTLARANLLKVSGRETYTDADGKSQPAIRWFLDVIARPEDAFKHQVFRIENLELLDTLGLERRQRYRYGFNEFGRHLQELSKQADLAREIDSKQMSAYQRKVLELERKIGIVDLLIQAYAHPPIRPETAQADLMEAIRRQERLRQRHPPLAIPPVGDNEEWEMYTRAWTKDLVQSAFGGKEPDPATETMTKILVAYGDGDVRTFNTEVARFRALLEADTPKDLDLRRTRFEAFFNHFGPFDYSKWLYVVAFVFAALAWLGWSRPLNRSAFCLLALILAVHTFALIARIYISGRPPVTNLYSSAVFIGWACVLAGLILEVVYKIGIGNVLAAVSGFFTLSIASYLGTRDGDTFTVLQAVLDTQFWLSTHVVTITLGYAATYVAGTLGVLYVLTRLTQWLIGLGSTSETPGMQKAGSIGRDLARMIYGTVCFALFFSFVGTVLGGLWADDSWGRFWGWDPKENGALIIVLWNALILHARWDGMVKDRGLALLAIGGNIATSWSWFGVNELGVGLHSYGFTEGVLRNLGLFALSQLALIAVCLLLTGRRSADSRRPPAKSG